MKHVFALFALLISAALFGQSGHQLRFKVKGYTQPDMYLAYYMGESQYLLDTVSQDAAGYYTFQGEEPLPGGVYLAVLAPDNQFMQILVSEGEQHFTVETDKDDLVKKTKIKGSPDNQIYYEYLNYLNDKRPVSEELTTAYNEAANETEKAADKANLDALDQEVLAYQRNLVKQHPTTLTALLIRANLPLDTPEYSDITDAEEQQRKLWRWTQAHYFDNMSLSDARLLRTPFLWQRLDYFVNKLTVQNPDTIADAIVQILNRLEPATETFKYYLIHYLNEYARSNIVGMDAVYVRLVDDYYATGKAPWTSEEQLAKIVENANTLRPILIGKKAPDLKMEKRDGSAINLYDVDAEYTVLYFWRYDCGHCKKSTPHIKEFYEKYKDKGVKIFSVCTKTKQDIPGCWEYIDENGIGDWVQVVDPYLRSRYNKIYDTKTTPQIFILDHNKTIVSKRIAAEQLGEVIDHLMEAKSLQEKENTLENK